MKPPSSFLLGAGPQGPQICITVIHFGGTRALGLKQHKGHILPRLRPLHLLEEALQRHATLPKGGTERPGGAGMERTA